MDFNHRAEPIPDMGRVRTLPEGRGNLAGGVAAEARRRARAGAADGEFVSSTKQVGPIGEFVSSTKQVGPVGPGVTLTELLARASAEQPGDGVRADGRPAPMPAVARLRGGWSTRHILLLFGLCFITGGDCMPISALQARRSGEPDLLPRVGNSRHQVVLAKAQVIQRHNQAPSYATPLCPIKSN